jgi:erythritol kinase
MLLILRYFHVSRFPDLKERITMATLCIDAGTTLIKAVIFDEAGKELVVASRTSGVSNPLPHLSEQSMNDVWASAISAALEVIEHVSPGIAIDRVAVTAQGDGAWIIDSAGVPVRPAILWNDGRAANEVGGWSRNGVLEKAFALNGSLTSLGLPNAIMAHLAEVEPESLVVGNRVLTCGSWLFFKLTNQIGLHPSEASAPWLDISSGAISDELVDLFGLSAHRDLIPDILSPTETSAPMMTSVAKELGLGSNIPVTLAPYDIVATATGCGVVHEGEAYAILGTTLCPGTIVDVPRVSDVPSGLNLHTGTVGSYLRAFPTLTGAGALTWLAKVLNVETIEELTPLAASAPAGSGSLIVLPYLSPAGERAPFLNIAARGVIHGLTFEHDRGHIARAFFESQAHVIRECLGAAGVAPTSLTLSGGGAQSSLWCQIIADVTGIRVTRTRDSQVGAKGAFMYAALAGGDVANLEEARNRFVTVGDVFVPNETTASLYSSAHLAFLRLRNELITQSWAEGST